VYTVSIANAYHCVSISDSVAVQLDDAVNTTPQNETRIFPNGDIEIGTQDATVMVSNLSGASLAAFETKSGEIVSLRDRLRTLPAGVYFICVRSRGGVFCARYIHHE